MDRKKIVFFAVWLAVISLTLSGCTKFFGPSDEEVIKAITDSDVFKSGKIVLLSPVVIVKKESRQKDGGWPVKVKITVASKSKDGKTGSPLERTPKFKIYKSKDSTGKTIWKARVGV